MAAQSKIKTQGYTSGGCAMKGLCDVAIWGGACRSGFYRILIARSATEYWQVPCHPSTEGP